jgi:hypothetical protein
MPLNYVFLLEKMGCKLSLKTLSVTLILHLAIPSLKKKSYLIFNYLFPFFGFFFLGGCIVMILFSLNMHD